MAVSLHGLRYKIAAAAAVKASVHGAVRVPGAASLVSGLAERLTPPGQEVTGSYRGLAAGLLRQALPDTPVLIWSMTRLPDWCPARPSPQQRCRTWPSAPSKTPPPRI